MMHYGGFRRGERGRLPVGQVSERGQGWVLSESPASCPAWGWHSTGWGERGGSIGGMLFSPDPEIPPPADALHTHSSLFLEGSSQESPPIMDTPASPPQAPRSQRPGRRMSQGSSHSDSSESSDSLAPAGASQSE